MRGEKLTCGTTDNPTAVERVRNIATKPQLDTRRKFHPHQLTGDTKYGTIENIVDIQEQHMCAHLPLSPAGQRAVVFGELVVCYDAAADAHHCPGDKVLPFLSRSDAAQPRVYRATATSCKARALRAWCTASPR